MIRRDKKGVAAGERGRRGAASESGKRKSLFNLSGLGSRAEEDG